MRRGDASLRIGLRTAISVHGVRLVLLPVPAAPAVEDDVARQMDQPSAARRSRNDLRPFGGHRPQVGAVLPVRRVDDALAPRDSSANGVLVADVQAQPLARTSATRTPFAELSRGSSAS